MIQYRKSIVCGSSILVLCLAWVFPMLSFSCHKPALFPPYVQAYDAGNLPASQRGRDSLRQDTLTCVYLSFDDGILKGSEVLDQTAFSDSVPLTVFLIGKNVLRNDSTRRLYEAYRRNPFIEIGNHSFTHAGGHYRRYYAHPDTVEQDFILNADTLLLTGDIARLPGRNCWRTNDRSRDDLPDGKAAADSLRALHYRVFGWDMEWSYNGAGRLVGTADEMLGRIDRMAQRKNSFTANHIVLLLHDPLLQDSSNVAEIREFIHKLKVKGNYRLEQLGKYP